jgi:hypothetical protein
MNRILDEFAGAASCVWFFGVVEDRKDPLFAGRVRVRCYGWHTDNKSELPTSSLPWAQVMTPITSAAMSGIGTSATGLVEGTTVVGFFMDGINAQLPLVLGSVPGINSKSSSETDSGFADPNRKYPLETGYPDTPKLAYDRFKDDSVATARANTASTTTATGSEWTEPSYRTEASVYPHNHVHRSESGHTFEVDDTEGKERLLKFHKTGTYEEILPDGSRSTKVVGDDYEVVISNKRVYVKGSCYITIDGSAEFYVKGNLIQKVDGNHNMEIAGTQTIKASHTYFQNDVDVDAVLTATTEVTAAGIKLTKHFHKDSPGLGEGFTTEPKGNK